MLTINHIAYYLPQAKPIMQLPLPQQPPGKLKLVYEKIFGIKTVLVSDMPVLEFIAEPVHLLAKQVDLLAENIKYLIHTHTSYLMTPFNMNVTKYIKEKFNLKIAYHFGMTMHKCAAGLKAIEILEKCFSKITETTSALILTGEIAFSPALRYIPRTGMAGDASTAILVSNAGNQHQLLGISIHLLSDYHKGIYMTDAETQSLDTKFIAAMGNVILSAIAKSKLQLKDINLILPHNVNLPTWQKLAAYLHFDINDIYLNHILHFGHCFTSDGFINLALAQKTQRLKPGDYYLIATAGMGMYLAAAVFQA